MSLRPKNTIQKVLISTRSRLVGEFERADVLLSHAWPPMDNNPMVRWSEGPASLSTYVFAFETEPDSRTPGEAIPDYSGIGDWICTRLAVLFGKRFDNHGLLE